MVGLFLVGVSHKLHINKTLCVKDYPKRLKLFINVKEHTMIVCVVASIEPSEQYNVHPSIGLCQWMLSAFKDNL